MLRLNLLAICNVLTSNIMSGLLNKILMIGTANSISHEHNK